MGSKLNKPFSSLGDLSKQRDILVKKNDLNKFVGGKKGTDIRYNPCGGIVPQ